MDGVVGVECRAPKAGALPGCATPRPFVRINYTRLRNTDVSQPADSAVVPKLCQKLHQCQFPHSRRKVLVVYLDHDLERTLSLFQDVGC